ncbi:hypothetical protein [Streptomyces sp. V3I7]|uniref:hypothetical protein n=1 Tax=Streptomyces sp. V3I7 TaxID=3042278 RepID=UPI002786FC84|nr:hypothetical protein [Streptomyces sp. V3I7]MDQ0992103.1 hypothetical protein [Streptomyces sp. V3I7]
MTTSRSAYPQFLYGPLLLGAYGLLRILDGLDGERGPGPAWTAGHLCFLAGVLLLVLGYHRIRPLTLDTRLTTAAFWTTCAGALALGVQFTADVVSGFAAADHQAMSDIVGRFMAIPGVEPAFYAYGPLLFFLGQLTLTVQLAARKVLKPWAPPLVLADSLLAYADKDLIPLGAALLLYSYAPLYRGRVLVAEGDNVPLAQGQRGGRGEGTGA